MPANYPNSSPLDLGLPNVPQHVRDPQVYEELMRIYQAIRSLQGSTKVANWSYVNRLINSDKSVNQIYNIAQAASGTAVTPTASQFITDQWWGSISQASKLTFQQVSDAPAGLKYSTKITVAAQFNPGAADYFGILQNIEGQNIIDFQLGTAGAATLILSQFIKGSVAGTYPISLRNSAGNRSYVGTVEVTTNWQRLTISLVGDITGTWLTDNQVGLEYRIDLGSGSNFNTPAINTWQAGAYLRAVNSVTFVNQAVGSTLNITGCQVEKGVVGQTLPSEYEVLFYAEQLYRASRYLPCFTGFNSSGIVNGLSTDGYTFSTSQGTAYFAFKVPTRVPVTGVGYSPVANFNFANPGVGSAVTGITFVASSTHLIGVAAITGTGTPYGIDKPAVLFGAANAIVYFLGARL